MMSDNQVSQCEGCALKTGAAANCEPANNIKAQLCVLGAIPFYCHEKLDWQNPEAHKAKRADVKVLGVGICQGWKREVAELAKTGYYKDRGDCKQDMAAIGIANLAKFIESKRGSQEKKDASEVLEFIIKELNEQRGFFSEKGGAIHATENSTQES